VTFNNAQDVGIYTGDTVVRLRVGRLRPDLSIPDPGFRFPGSDPGAVSMYPGDRFRIPVSGFRFPGSDPGVVSEYPGDRFRIPVSGFQFPGSNPWGSVRVPWRSIPDSGFRFPVSGFMPDWTSPARLSGSSLLLCYICDFRAQRLGVYFRA
jgi:hypothetical protein